MPATESSQASWWEGLSLEWDNCPAIRDSIRAGERLLKPHPCLNQEDGTVIRSIHNCRFNKIVLLPALKRWGDQMASATPSVDYLFVEVDNLYKANQRTEWTVADKHQDAWAVRRLMGLVKAQVTKKKPPTEAWL